MNQFDYSARWMDPRIGRFTTVDPLAEKYYSVSPYVYCHNNPMNKIDPSGMNDDWYMNEETGELYFNKDFSDEKITHNDQTFTRIGNNSLLGNMKNKKEQSYDSNESSALASDNGYSIDPTQQLVSKNTQQFSSKTGEYSVSYTFGKEITINEEYTFNTKKSLQKNTSSSVIKHGVHQNLAQIITGGYSTQMISREYYTYKEISTTNKTTKNILSKIYMFGTGTMGSHDETTKLNYSSWHDYYEHTNGKGSLLFYKQ